MHFNDLPAEIRLSIFRLATLKISQHEDVLTDYRPFEAVALRDRDWSSSAQRALNVKMNIVLVCKEWKIIATEMLYECIRIQHGTEALLAALEGHGDTPLDNGRWVRRVEISERIQDFDPFNPRMVVRVLERCPLVETIVRPCLSEAGGAALGKVRWGRGEVFPSFPSVKRVDWWVTGVIPRHRATSESHMQFLVELVAHTPNLQYLTLSGCSRWRSPYLFTPDGLFSHPPYKSITTLRIEGEIENMLALDNAGLPNLQRLVLGGVYAPALPILRTHGPLIRCLELLSLPGTTTSSSLALPTVGLGTKYLFETCPNIKEFYAPLSLGPTLLKENADHRVDLPSLSCIRIKIDSSSPFTSENFANFIKTRLSCPSLERVVLHGRQDLWKDNACYSALKSFVSERKYVTLEFA